MIFVFGDYRLDQDALELRGPDGAVAAEPRVLETLIYLVRNRGRVVSKDELAAEVWQGAHITDSTIARSVMGARRAIDDDAARPRAIHTVHGRGYRFDLPVQEVVAAEAATTVDQWLARRRRRTLPVLLAVAAAAVLLVAVSVVWLRSGAVARTGGAEPAPLTFQVEAPPDDDELQLVALSVAEELRWSLTDMLGAPADPVKPADYADQLLVRLSPGDTAGHAVLEATLEPGGENAGAAPVLLARHQIPYRLPAVGTERFVAVRNAVVRRIVQRLATARQDSAPGLDAGDEALHLFLQASAEWTVGCGGEVTATQLRRSLELDPESAPAWYMLALSAWSQLNFCSGDLRLLDEAEQALHRAIELDPERPAYRQRQASFLLYRGQVEEAYALLRDLAAEAPHHAFVEMGLSEALRYAGFLSLSRERYDDGLADHPETPYLYDFFVPYPYLYEGEWEPFLRLLAGRGSPYLRYYRGYAEWRLGHDAVARKVLAPAFIDHPGDPFARLCEALLANLKGEPWEAQVVLEQLARQRREQGSGDGEVSFKIAELLVMAGAVDEGLDQLSLAVEQGFFCPRCLASSSALEPLAGSPRFRALLATAVARHEELARRFDLSPEPPADASWPARQGGSANDRR